MNKKNNRKGFTTVELVIVIAVIAILATVLIPTFSGLIGNANESAALQTARNAQTAIMNEDVMPGGFELKDGDVVYICVNNKYWFTLTAGQLEDDVAEHTYTAAANSNPATLLEAGEGKTAFPVEVIATTAITDLPTGVTVYVKRAA